jgi:hypothetical protein
MSARSSGTFHAVSVINASVSSLFIQIEFAQIVVEVAMAGTQVSAQESGVGREHCRHIELTHSRHY